MKENRWVEIDFTIGQKGVECPTSISLINQNQSADIYIIGGRTDDGDEEMVLHIMI